MAIPFSPYISFPMNTAEALDYYQAVFGGELVVEHYRPEVVEQIGFPVPDGAVAHAELSGGAVTLAGGDDVMGTGKDLRDQGLMFMLQPSSVEEAQAFVQRLVADGGQQPMPFEQAPWGSYYGQVLDKYGILWHFNVA